MFISVIVYICYVKIKYPKIPIFEREVKRKMFSTLVILKMNNKS